MAHRSGTDRGRNIPAGTRTKEAETFRLKPDVGPQPKPQAAKVNGAFFADTSIKANILCNLGYGEPAGLRPRLDFGEVRAIL